MARIRRGNVVLNVKDYEVQYYLLLGYNVTDEKGNIIKEAIPTDIVTLQKAYVDQRNRINELEAIVAKLTTENEKLRRTSEKTKKPTSV